MDVTDNLPGEGGTDSAPTDTSIDNPANWNFLDPDEDNQEVATQPGTEGVPEAKGKTPDASKSEDDSEADDDPDKAADSDEPDDPDAKDNQDNDDDEGKRAPEIADDAEIELHGGEKVQFSELKAGYMRQSDHSRKSMENANYRKAVSAQGERIEKTVQAFTDFLAKQLPDEPDIALAATKPEEYVKQKARYDAILSQVKDLLAVGESAKEATEELSLADRQKLLRDETAALASMFPQTTSDKGRKEFFDTAFKAATHLGYSDDEIKSATDHRLLGMAYWAQKGLAAEEARKKVKEKVQDAPPVTPTRRPQGKGGQGERSRNAMRELERSGSINDALKVDFD